MATQRIVAWHTIVRSHLSSATYAELLAKNNQLHCYRKTVVAAGQTVCHFFQQLLIGQQHFTAQRKTEQLALPL
ncbi:MAG: hypothetical protein VX346_25335 [Planctomycetota bacterium]|nr:hypothetical protein [Planctomycetota bacterium]